MIKLFLVDEYYVIFVLTDVNIKICCTNFIKFWSCTEKISSFSPSFIEEISIKNKLSYDNIEITTQYIESAIKLRIFKMQTDTLKIKLGEFKLLPSNEEKSIEKLFHLIYEEFNLILEKQIETENLILKLQIENENLRNDFKSLTENTIIRENKLLDKACFLINEKKRKIQELENNLTNSSCKLPKSGADNEQGNDRKNLTLHSDDSTLSFLVNEEISFVRHFCQNPFILRSLHDRNAELDENSSDCHSNLSCSIVENEVNVDADENAPELEKCPRSHCQSNNSAGNDSENELFPENKSPKLTAVPIKIRVKEHTKEILDSAIHEAKKVVHDSSGGSQTSIQYLPSDLLKDTLVSSDLFDQM